MVTGLLRQFGHNVLTVQEAGQANQRIPDDQVLAFATSQGRAVLTVNRDDFIRLHRMSPDHAGIIVCTEDLDRQRLATRIHEAIAAEASLFGKLIRVNRPPVERGGSVEGRSPLCLSQVRRAIALLKSAMSQMTSPNERSPFALR